MNFSATLKELRESRNITQEELASYLKVSRPTIAGYETKNRQPDFEKLIKLSRYFNVSIDYLLTNHEESPLTPFPVKPGTLSEKTLDQHVLTAYRGLSLPSKQDTLSYIRLLELRDKEYAARKHSQ